MIPQRNLSLLSNRLARSGGRRIVEAVLDRDYCLAWFLVGLSRSGLREKLLFKGAEYEDLPEDAQIRAYTLNAEATLQLGAARPAPGPGTGFRARARW
jgi:hypothetical protein